MKRKHFFLPIISGFALLHLLLFPIISGLFTPIESEFTLFFGVASLHMSAHVWSGNGTTKPRKGDLVLFVSVVMLVLELGGVLTCMCADEILKEFPYRAQGAWILFALMVPTIVVGFWNT